MKDLSQPAETRTFSADCPCRVLFEEISDKWSMMILSVLDGGPCRFNDLKRRLEGVSQKSLTHTLRKLERNGMITRNVLSGSPVAVEYRMDELGRTVLPPFREIYRWTHQNQQAIEEARAVYDARQNA